MPVIDVIVAILICFFIFRGYKRGVLREIFVILRLLVIFLITIFSYGKLAVAFQAAISKMPTWIAQMIAFSVIFIPISIMVWFINIIIQGKLEKRDKPVSIVNSILGGIFGLLRGVFIISLVFMFADFYQSKGDNPSVFGKTISHKMIGNVAPSMKNFVFGIFSHSDSNAEKDSPKNNPLTP